ncbi:MAG: T9SS type A sorting domain-containing protein, partial [Spirochaetes bacterium]|nr:T9SS type A sorting domain-containing protein [Spirochaetota bacterium]
YKIWYDNNSDGIGYGMITFDQSGYYTSSIMDAGDTVSLDKLYYEALLPSNTYIKFQIRGGKTLEELNSAQFTGPEKSFSTYYSINGETVDGITNIQYIQYKVWFSTGDDTYSPELQLIRFTYSDAGWGNNDDSTLYTFPSPYKPDVSDLSIRYSLEKDAEVNIKVYSRNGKEVWSKDSTGTSGWNVTSWNGKSSGGKTQGSGVYLCVITKRYPEGDKSIKSMILLVR